MKKICCHFVVVGILAPWLSLALLVFTTGTMRWPDKTLVDCIAAGIGAGIFGLIITFYMPPIISFFSGAMFGGITSTGAVLKMWHAYITILPLLIVYGFLARGLARDIGFPVGGIYVIAIIVSVPIARLSQWVWNK
jgi:hypothetical protein